MLYVLCNTGDTHKWKALFQTTKTWDLNIIRRSIEALGVKTGYIERSQRTYPKIDGNQNKSPPVPRKKKTLNRENKITSFDLIKKTVKGVENTWYQI